MINMLCSTMHKNIEDFIVESYHSYVKPFKTKLTCVPPQETRTYSNSIITHACKTHWHRDALCQIYLHFFLKYMLSQWYLTSMFVFQDQRSKYIFWYILWYCKLLICFNILSLLLFVCMSKHADISAEICWLWGGESTNTTCAEQLLIDYHQLLFEIVHSSRFQSIYV